jgi:hypothetical protein
MEPLDREKLLAANEIYAKVVALAREAKSDPNLALALHAQGHSFVLSDELEAAEKAFDESREISVRLAADESRPAPEREGDKRRATLSSVMLGYVAVSGGRLEDGLPRIVAAFVTLAADDPARQLVLLRLHEVSKRFDAKRFEAALKAAAREQTAAVREDLQKALAGMPAK